MEIMFFYLHAFSFNVSEPFGEWRCPWGIEEDRRPVEVAHAYLNVKGTNFLLFYSAKPRLMNPSKGLRNGRTALASFSVGLKRFIFFIITCVAIDVTSVKLRRSIWKYTAFFDISICKKKQSFRNDWL